MAGFWNKSNTQIHDRNGKPLIAAKAYFYLGGTTTPIKTYRSADLGEVNENPNPVETDGSGFFPSVFFDEADEYFRMRIATASGTLILDVDGIPIIGPSGGGGGGSETPVDPNSVYKTGDMKARYGTGTHPGFVRGNGRTLGSATSGASERANDDAQALFEYLWEADSTLEVLGGRGVSAAADWNANKQLSLPDFRGRAFIGLDTMGNTAAGIVAEATALGWKGGTRSHTLALTEIPAHDHNVSLTAAPNHVHSVELGIPINDGSGFARGSSANTITRQVDAGGGHNHTVSQESKGGGAAHNNLQPSLAVTVYIKL